MPRVDTSDDLYRRLGVEPSASTDEIGAAFRVRAKALHPDLHPGDAATEDEFKALTHAYDVLTSPTARAAYDQRRSVRPPDGSTASAGAASRTNTGTHAPVFRTARAARAAIWWGVGLALLGLAGTAVLAVVPTGDGPKTITLWIVVVKLVVCGVILASVGWWRLQRLDAEAGSPPRVATHG
jgi:DnaJ domain